MTRTMSDKQKRAINAGRKRAGLKPIKWKSKAGKKSLSAFKKAGIPYSKKKKSSYRLTV